MDFYTHHTEMFPLALRLIVDKIYITITTAPTQNPPKYFKKQSTITATVQHHDCTTEHDI
jgi:hypothetical protein